MQQRFLEPEPLCHEWRAWNMAFHVRDPLPHWPRPYQAALVTTSDPAYAKSGRHRPATPNATVQITLEGSGEFLFQERRIPLKPGSAFVTQLSDPNVEYRYPPGAKDPWRFVFLEFSEADSLVDGLVQRFGHVFALNIDSPVVSRLIHLASGEQGRLRHLDLDAAQAALLVQDVLSSLAASGAQKCISTPPAAILVERAVMILQNGLDRPFNTRTLAAELGVSAEHLCRVFQRTTGESPQTCRRRLQMRQACALLTDETLDIETIALRLGYRDRANFGRAFRLVVGQTPARWRRSGGLPPR